MAEPIMFVNEIKDAFVNNAMDVFYALAIFVAGYVVAVVLASIARKTLLGFNVDNYMKERCKVPIKLSSVVSSAIKWYLILVVLHTAINQLTRLDAVAVQLQNLIGFMPTIISAVIVLFASYVIGIFVKDEIFGEKEIYSIIIGKGLFFLVMLIGGVMSLSIIQIETFLISAITLVIIGSVGLGAAIALGLGLKDIIRELAVDYLKKHKKKQK